MTLDFSPAISHNIGNNIVRTAEQASSGRRINAASDDVAGFGVSVKINTTIRSQESAASNTITGVSLIQTAEGGLRQVIEQLHELQQLSIQSGNGVLTDSDRAALQQQASQVLAGIQDSLANTRFNGQRPLSQDKIIELQVGADAGDRVSIPGVDVGRALDGFGLNGIDLADSGNLASTLDVLAQSLSFIQATAAEFGASHNRLDSTLNNLGLNNVRLSETASRMEDADMAKVISELIRNQLIQQSEIALRAQANVHRGLVLSQLNA